MIAEARKWNARHKGGPILDPWLSRVREDNPEYQSYLRQLRVGDAMARVVIPSINSDLPIYHGTTEETLAKGIGHLFGTSLPVGGEDTHAVLTGHTGLTEATLWDNLSKVREGDAVYMDVAGEKLKYVVDRISVVRPEETDGLRPEPGKDLLSLVTCTPYGVNSHRLVLTGHRVPVEPGEERLFDVAHSPWQWWMTAVSVFVGLVVLIALIVWARARHRRAAAAGAEVAL